MMRSWIHKLFARPATRPIRKGAPSTTRLLLEVPSISPLAPRAGDGGDVFLTDGAGAAAAKNPSNPIGTTPVSNAANVNTDVIETNRTPHNETSIAVNPTNPLNMVGAANDYQVSVGPGGHVSETAITRVRVTNDGGKSWTSMALVSNDYNFTGDPGVAFDARGTAYVSTLGFRYNGGNSGTGVQPDILAARSTDGGATWSRQLRVATGTGSFFSPGRGLDKESIAAWDGNAVVTWTQFNQAQKGGYVSSPLYASVTHDGGNTWSPGVLISGSRLYNQGSVPTVAADGGIYVSFLNGDLDVAADGFRDHYMVVKLNSQTGRPTGPAVDVGLIYDGIYDYPVNADGSETYQDSQFRSWAFGSIAADPTDANHLALVWSDMRNNPYPGAFLPHAPDAFPDPYAVQTNSDVIVSMSFDGGKTWSPGADRAGGGPARCRRPVPALERLRPTRQPPDRLLRPLLRPGQPRVRLHAGHGRQDAGGPVGGPHAATHDGAVRSHEGRPLVQGDGEPGLPRRDALPGGLQRHRRHPDRGGRHLDRHAGRRDVPGRHRTRPGCVLRPDLVPAQLQPGGPVPARRPERPGPVGGRPQAALRAPPAEGSAGAGVIAFRTPSGRAIRRTAGSAHGRGFRSPPVLFRLGVGHIGQGSSLDTKGHRRSASSGDRHARV